VLSLIFIPIPIFATQEVGSLVLGCSLEFPQEQESSPRPQVRSWLG
jgi:hypothetical protein